MTTTQTLHCCIFTHQTYLISNIIFSTDIHAEAHARHFHFTSFRELRGISSCLVTPTHSNVSALQRCSCRWQPIDQSCASKQFDMYISRDLVGLMAANSNLQDCRGPGVSYSQRARLSSLPLCQLQQLTVLDLQDRIIDGQHEAGILAHHKISLQPCWSILHANSISMWGSRQSGMP